jgi:hypothetical protein
VVLRNINIDADDLSFMGAAMITCNSTTVVMQRLFSILVVLWLAICSIQQTANAASFVKKDANRNAGIALLMPSAQPYALQADGRRQTVRISVPARLAAVDKSKVKVFLRRIGDKQSIAMNDRGVSGDYVANDGIHGVSVQIDTARVKPDTCLQYEAYVTQERARIVSKPLRFCVSSFPVRVAKPNVEKPVVLDGGTKAVADEVLLYARETTSAATIRELARNVNARVVGSIIPLNLYQLRLATPVSAKRLLEIVAQLEKRADIAGAGVNSIGESAGHVDVTTDPEFASQHGVKLVARHPTLADTYVWDGGAVGTGVTVIVADQGLDRKHPELGTPGDCQVVNDECGPLALNDDNAAAGVAQWHGTRVAGVISAKAYNSQGIAGVAHGSIIRPYKIASYAVADMDQIFIDVSAYVISDGASVINASFSGGPWSGVGYAANVTALCAAVNTAITSGFGAIAVIAAGNNGADNWYYPARCNQHASVPVANRSRIIAVGNSTSVNTTNCGSVGTEQRCAAAVPANPDLLGSNYGNWVDIVAPGSDIRTTKSGGYATSTGTSFSTPIVSGAVAILKGCGVSLNSIKPTLIASSLQDVPYPNSGAPAGNAPRLDIYRALQTFPPAATNLSAVESYAEDFPSNLTNIVITGNLSGCATYTATLTLSNVAAGTLSTATSGTVTSTFAGGVWTASGPLANVNTLLAGVTFNPAPDFNGNFNISTSVSDGFSPAITGTKAVTGSAVNDAPSFVAGVGQTVQEDAGAQSVAGWATAISAGPANESAQMLAFNITGNDNAGLFSVAPAISPTGSLSYTPADNANGSALVTVQLVDNGGGTNSSAPQSFTIHVGAVNDAPSFVAGGNQSVPEDAGAQSVAGWATAISAGPANESAQMLSFNIAGNTNPALFSAVPAITPSGTLTYTPAPHANGTATITVELVDNGGVVNGGANTSASHSFTIEVTSVNDAPSFVAGVGQTVQEDAGAQSVASWATAISAGPANESAQMLTFNITGNDNAGLFSVAPAISQSGTLTYTPAANAHGIATITAELVDDGGVANGGVNTSASQSFTIEVTSVNDAPSGSEGTVSMDEDTAYQFIASDFGFSDPLDSPPNSLGAIRVTTVPLIGALELSSATVSVGQSVPIANLGDLTFASVGDAYGSPYASFTFQVVDDGGSNVANGDVNTDPAPNTLTINVNPKEDALSGTLEISPAESPANRKLGVVLNAVTGGLFDVDCPPPPLTAPATSSGLCMSTPCELAYQWKRSDNSDPAIASVPISGATNRDYTLKQIDATNTDYDKYMSLCVSTGSGAACSQQCTVKETTAVGDPHITTVDGLRYDFQGEGDFVALRGDNGMEIQLRMAAVSAAWPLTDPYSGLTVGVSVNTAVAAQVGQYRVTYQPDTSPGAASGTFVLRVDGVPKTLPAGGIDLGDGGMVSQLSGGGIQIDFPDRTTLMVSAPPYTFYNASWIHISVFHTTAYKGIMGARSKGSWLPMLSNGSVLGPKPAALHDRYVDLYETFANSWRVTSSLFDSAAATNSDKKWPMEKGPYIKGDGPVARPLRLKDAELACKGILGKNEKADCIFDVRVVGQKGIAKGHLQNQKIRLGAVKVIVRAADNLNDRGEMEVTAMVARHAMVVPKVKGLRTVPAGTVQFMLGDKTLGKPVKLDANGQAKLVVTRQNLERFNTGKLAITAQYLPSRDRANVFLPSISRKLTRELVQLR